MQKGAGRKIILLAIFRFPDYLLQVNLIPGELFWLLKTLIFISHRRMVACSQIQLNSLSTHVLFRPTPNNNSNFNRNQNIYWDFTIASCIAESIISISLLNETMKQLLSFFFFIIIIYYYYPLSVNEKYAASGRLSNLWKVRHLLVMKPNLKLSSRNHALNSCIWASLALG